ncbi:unnamed protein product, partial [Porites lobata]
MRNSELPFVEVQLSSYEVKSGDVHVSVRGRLRKSIQFWREIDAPRFILDTIEFEKSLWEPTQVITWLGTVIDTSQCIISATDARIQSLSEDLSFLLDSTHPSLYQVRKLASVCGKIISLGTCVGNVARLMTRNIFAVINFAMNWNSMVSLTPGCV